MIAGNVVEQLCVFAEYESMFCLANAESDCFCDLGDGLSKVATSLALVVGAAASSFGHSDRVTQLKIFLNIIRHTSGM